MYNSRYWKLKKGSSLEMVERFRAWLRRRPKEMDFTREERGHLRDWDQAQARGRSDLEYVGHTGFIDLGQEVLWHSASGLTRDYGNFKIPITAFEGFAIFGGCQYLIDTFTDQVERITSERGDVAHS